MTGIRRALVLIGLTVAVMVGAAIPASATFADTVTVKTSIATQSVPAPARPTVTLQCWSTQNPTTGVWSHDFRATVKWTAVPTTRNHTGYALVANTGGLKQEMDRVGTAAVNGVVTYVSATMPQSYLSTYRPTLSISTLTSHGWTAESPQTGVLAC
jgi:ABC-type phosphate transport system substrate-binding protein